MFYFIFFLLFGCVKNSNTDSTPVEIDPITWESCENIIGDHPCNIITLNQFGLEESLYEHYGKPIVLDFSAGWCGPCKAAAQEVQETQNLHASAGLVYITILIENSQGQPPDLADLERWGEAHGIIDAPIWAGSRDLISYEDLTAGWYLEGWPTFYFIDKEMRLRGYTRGFSTTSLEAGISQISQ